MINKTFFFSVRFRQGNFLAAYFMACLMVSPLSPAFAKEIPHDLMVNLNSLAVSKSEFICLALNDYFEARGESLVGRLAVAKVVLNRAMDSRFPANLCSVIKQNRARTLHRCQFSWTCDGRSDTPRNRIAWYQSLKLAAAVLQKDSNIDDPTNGALWYHAVFVRPPWSNRLEVSGIIGGHVFYGDKKAMHIGWDRESDDSMMRDLNRFAQWIDSRAPQSTTIVSR